MSNEQLSSGRDPATERVIVTLKSLAPPWSVEARAVMQAEGNRLVAAIAKWTDAKPGAMTQEQLNEVRRLMVAAFFLIGAAATAGPEADWYETAMARSLAQTSRDLSEGKSATGNSAPLDPVFLLTRMRDECLRELRVGMATAEHLSAAFQTEEVRACYRAARDFLGYAESRISRLNVADWLRGLK